MPRTAAVTLPSRIALPSANNAPMRKLSAPGPATSSTPQKPTSSAVRRSLPTLSFSHSTAASAANSGDEKLIATAPASGIKPKAMMMQLCAMAWVVLRPKCWPMCRVWKAENPLRGRINSEQIASEPNDRKHSTSANE